MRIQIMVCFDDGKWLCDYINILNGQTRKEALDAYMKQYQQVGQSMDIVGTLLPGIIHMSVME